MLCSSYFDPICPRTPSVFNLRAILSFCLGIARSASSWPICSAPTRWFSRSISAVVCCVRWAWSWLLWYPYSASSLYWGSMHWIPPSQCSHCCPSYLEPIWILRWLSGRLPPGGSGRMCCSKFTANDLWTDRIISSQPCSSSTALSITILIFSTRFSVTIIASIWIGSFLIAGQSTVCYHWYLGLVAKLFCHFYSFNPKPHWNCFLSCSVCLMFPEVSSTLPT